MSPRVSRHQSVSAYHVLRRHNPFPSVKSTQSKALTLALCPNRGPVVVFLLTAMWPRDHVPTTPIHSLTRSSMEFFQHVKRGYKEVSHAFATRRSSLHYCPHCDEYTPWYTAVWQGHYECMKCGRNPLKDAEHGHQDSSGRHDHATHRPDRRKRAA